MTVAELPNTLGPVSCAVSPEELPRRAKHHVIRVTVQRNPLTAFQGVGVQAPEFKSEPRLQLLRAAVRVPVVNELAGVPVRRSTHNFHGTHWMGTAQSVRHLDRVPKSLAALRGAGPIAK